MSDRGLSNWAIFRYLPRRISWKLDHKQRNPTRTSTCKWETDIASDGITYRSNLYLKFKSMIDLPNWKRQAKIQLPATLNANVMAYKKLFSKESTGSCNSLSPHQPESRLSNYRKTQLLDSQCLQCPQGRSSEVTLQDQALLHQPWGLCVRATL